MASVAMHRGELLQILLNACDPAAVHANKQVRHVEQRRDRVTAHFSDGTTASADILVAADGLSSPVRRLLTGATPRYAGYSAYRSVLEDFDPGSEWPRHGIIRTLSCGEYFGLGEITPRRYLWFLTKNRPLNEPESGGRKTTVVQTVVSWGPPIRSVVEATPEENILLHPVYKLRPLKVWRFGRIVLLGDAAHPIEPALGMGASLAIEDAVVLGQSLAETFNHGDAFRRYEQRRIPRVRKLVRWAAALARSEQMSNPLMCRMRDVSTRLTPERTARLLARRAFDFTLP
ncbi:MAG TPA: FAD-dependent monooxygenase [Actinomycetota bacterium]|nr:FAD-dependent monooxygenase [Actinomycetota bacterium]